MSEDKIKITADENYFILDGNKIPMSEETAESLRKEQWQPFDKWVDGIRISSCNAALPFPVRISIPNRKHGMDLFQEDGGGRCSGELLCAEDVVKLRDILTAIIKHHEG